MNMELVEMLLLDDTIYNMSPNYINIGPDIEDTHRVLDLTYHVIDRGIQICICIIKGIKTIYEDRLEDIEYFKRTSITLVTKDKTITKHYHFHDMDEQLKEKLINIYLKHENN